MSPVFLLWDDEFIESTFFVVGRSPKRSGHKPWKGVFASAVLLCCTLVAEVGCMRSELLFVDIEDTLWPGEQRVRRLVFDPCGRQPTINPSAQSGMIRIR